jgi:glutamate/tyrosine decarboxylase-like PLP-dependent enzyme
MTTLRRAAELAQEHLDGLAARSVRAEATFEDTLAALDGPLREAGEDPAAVVEHLVEAVAPATVASPGPRYFGFVTGGALPAALGADWLVSAWDQNAFSRVSSPAAAAVEAVTERWVLDALGLPAGAAVGFTTGATTANFTCLAAARNAVLARAGWDVESEGLFGAPRIRVIVGEQVHASMLVALRYAGLGAPAVRVPVDDQGAMRADALEIGDGPTLVCAQAGEVNTGAFDPLVEVVDAAHRRGGWVHVDGAFGMWAAASPRLRHLVRGAERADSWAVDAHKWLNVPYDGALAIVSDPAALHAAMGMRASYLPHGGGREPIDHVPEASRRARAVPIYAALRSLGRSGLAELVERCCAHARRFAARMHGLEGAEVLNEVVLNQVLLRFGDATEAVIERVQREGEAWFGGTVWRGRPAARVSFSNWSTTDEDVDRTAAAIGRALAAARD